MKKILWIVLGVIVLWGAYSWMSYNSFITASQAVDGQWAQVDTVLQRRFDLIPQLVGAVQGAMKQETAVFGAIADARTKYGSATTVDQKVQAASQLDGALSRLLVVMENYPQLKSVEVVQGMTVQIEGSENRISTERQRFNDVVQTYNTLIMKFPANVMASMFGFKERTFFKAAEGAAVAPVVKF